jgi:hypothetical protein
LNDVSEGFSDRSRQRGLIMTPAPDCHSRDVKCARCSAEAAKRQLKGGFVLSAGQPTLKSRCCYATVTHPHVGPKAWLCRPRHRSRQERALAYHLETIKHCAVGRYRTISEGKSRRRARAVDIPEGGSNQLIGIQGSLSRNDSGRRLPCFFTSGDVGYC